MRRINMTKVPINKCYSSPWCEPDAVCRCEAFEDAGGNRKHLVGAEKKLWEFVLGYEVDNGYTPTYSEIAKALGYTKHGEQTVRAMVQRMIAKHYFRLDQTKKFRKLIIVTL